MATKPPIGSDNRAISKKNNTVLCKRLFAITTITIIISNYLMGASISKLVLSYTSSMYIDQPLDDSHKLLSNDNTRFIALCSCTEGADNSEKERYTPLHWAFNRISNLIPHIEYTGMIIGKKHCEDYIEQWIHDKLLQRYDKEKIVNITTRIEVVYTFSNHKECKDRWPLNETLVGKSMTKSSSWIRGLHIPSKSTHFQRDMRDWGEVAASKGHRCNPSDTSIIHQYRSRELWTEHQHGHCAVIHFPAVMYWANLFYQNQLKDGLLGSNDTVLSMLTKRNSYEEGKKILANKKQFAILLTMSSFQPRYAADALVRHALCRLLNQKYKSTHCISSWKGEAKAYNVTIEKDIVLAYKAMSPYKFVITMTNHFQDGYLAEKTINPFLANAVTITSIPNVGQYINADGMITCNIPKDQLKKVQRYYKGNFTWMPFNTTPDTWAKDNSIQPIRYDPYAVGPNGEEKKGDDAVIEFAISQWETTLQPCIDEIIRIDNDDNEYIKKIMQPYILNGANSLFDGTYLANSFLNWFVWAKSPLVDGVEDQITSLEGMQEQTPNWGKVK